jgi:hypothetical protein
MKISIFCYVAVLALFVGGGPSLADTIQECMKCHRERSKRSIPSISLEDYQSSVHGKILECTDCHTQIEMEMHGSVKGDATVNCGECHGQENMHGLQSEDGNRPRCYSCHTRHRIYKKENEASSTHPSQFGKACAQCHPVECGKRNYLSWLPSIRVVSHSKQDYFRKYDKNNCIGCHQGKAVHGENTLINQEECYKCHSAMANRQVMGYIHANANLKRQPVVFAAGLIYVLFFLFLFWWGARRHLHRVREKREGN